MEVVDDMISMKMVITSVTKMTAKLKLRVAQKLAMVGLTIHREDSFFTSIYVGLSLWFFLFHLHLY
jgi:hypothetical protein